MSHDQKTLHGLGWWAGFFAAIARHASGDDVGSYMRPALGERNYMALRQPSLAALSAVCAAVLVKLLNLHPFTVGQATLARTTLQRAPSLDGGQPNRASVFEMSPIPSKCLGAVHGSGVFFVFFKPRCHRRLAFILMLLSIILGVSLSGFGIFFNPIAIYGVPSFACSLVLGGVILGGALFAFSAQSSALSLKEILLCGRQRLQAFGACSHR